MDNQAFEILLLMTSIAQLKDQGRVVSLYVESLNSLFPGYDLEWLEARKADGTGAVEVGTRTHKYGFVGYSPPAGNDPLALALIHNSGQMLAVILEKLTQEQALLEQNKRFEAIAAERSVLAEKLELRIAERTADLEAANRNLGTSQRNLRKLNADLEHRVERRTAEIERSRAGMEAFSYTVSHDLRAPLRAIDGFSRILLEEYAPSLPEEARHLLGRIVAGANRMGRLIEALLGLSRLERHQLSIVEVNVFQVVVESRDELVAAIAAQVPNPHGDELEWEIADLPTIQVDPDLVRQVFANLLGNAVKFTRSKPRPRIRVGAVQRPDGIWYHVSDNGIGFDMAYADKLFQAFQRLHGDAIEGIGIGLVTVKRIVDRLGGAIEAEGVPDQGATFRFRLGPVRN